MGKMIFLLAAGVILLIGLLTYSLVIRPQLAVDEVTPTPTEIPTPTPTPPYLAYINEEPNYAGIVESVQLPNLITLARDDGSKVVLTLQSDTQIHQITYDDTEPLVTDLSIDQITQGAKLSVYTKERNIVAVFLIDRASGE